MVHLGDVVLVDQLTQTRRVEHVEAHVVAGAGRAARADVGGDHVVGSALAGEFVYEFAADLPVGADHQSLLHCFLLQLASTPSSRLACANAASAASSCSMSCAAESCTRTRACPIGTTG